jgi:hypothetical protein
VPANSVGTVLTRTLFIFRKGEGSMTLHIMVAGRERFAAPYDPQNMGETASALNEHLPALRQFGRVAVFVTDGNVAHLIVTE